MFVAKALRNLLRARRGRSQPDRRSLSRPAILLVLFSLYCVCPAVAQTAKSSAVADSLWDDLREFVETSAVPGYEGQLAGKIRAKIATLHPVTDNLGDVIVTIGSGAPHRLIVTPIDEPGFVVSGIRADGYLRLQRLPQSGLPPIFNELYSAQPVRVGTMSGKWINGVIAGSSIHLQSGSASPGKLGDIENMYVDIGAASAAEARAAGVDLLSPVVIDRQLLPLSGREMAAASLGDMFGAAALVELLQQIDPAKVRGTLSVAFVVQQRTGARGLQRILSTTPADEMIYVGRLLPGGAVPGVQGMRRVPRREPGSGVLLGLGETNGMLSGFAADLKRLADSNKILLVTDYSAGVIPRSYLPLPAFPPRWAHLGIATAWRDTPVEMMDRSDQRALVALLEDYVGATSSPSSDRHSTSESVLLPGSRVHRPTANVEMLQQLAVSYGASNHEKTVRDEVDGMLPEWAKPQVDDAGNLILRVGTAPPNSKAPKILVVAHLDEIGFEVKSISNDGRLEVAPLGGMESSYYEGHPALVHTASGDRDAIIELPDGWDQPNFQWPTESERAIRADVGARSPEEVAKLGIKVGDSITIPKKYRALLGTRASARSFDDRVGCTALLSALGALGGPLQDRDVTFVWSTGEELGLDGAAALAKRLASEGREPDYVFAVDTFVSSDSPLESQRFADAQLGKGFVIRAVDNSNIVPRGLVERLAQLARANHIPVQYGVTGGGNDGSAFVRYGAMDVALGWPLRYSHSPAEVIDTRDVDALARIVAVIAKTW
ncbi:MAG TPA: M20/M25/M40 family metallo-hydrolase [Candidatus Polarisedimenticolia bacterium]|nr:M20/M25/M40 family metallo-hydrolase [Candidatus Polarisedimenticolia bacterium]